MNKGLVVIKILWPVVPCHFSIIDKFILIVISSFKSHYPTDAISTATDPSGGRTTSPRGRHEADTRVPGRRGYQGTFSIVIEGVCKLIYELIRQGVGEVLWPVYESSIGALQPPWCWGESSGNSHKTCSIIHVSHCSEVCPREHDAGPPDHRLPQWEGQPVQGEDVVLWAYLMVRAKQKMTNE